MSHIVNISGMGCDHCVMAVREALDALDFVAVVDVAIGRAVLDVPDDGTAPDWRDRVAGAIDEAGYDVTDISPADATASAT